MKLPNGFGSVYKLSGNRRNPWVARKTTGWTYNEVTQKSNPVYQFIGYYPTRKEALSALVNYNDDPHEIKRITFAEVYTRWSDSYFPKISKSNITLYKSAFKICTPIHDEDFANLKLDDLQQVLDESGKNKPILLKVKTLFNLMFEYGYAHEICKREKHEMVRYLDLSKFDNPNSRPHSSINEKTIKKLWDNLDEFNSLALMLIYTGLRVNELLKLKKENLHLEERWLHVEQSKTKNGIRDVPISEKIVKLFQWWLARNLDKDFVFITSVCYYRKLLDNMKSQNITPHDCRHTCISLLTQHGVDERVIQQIVGHAGSSLTQQVYTHIDLKTKLEAINKI